MNIKYVYRVLIPESWKLETTITERSNTEMDNVEEDQLRTRPSFSRKLNLRKFKFSNYFICPHA